LSKKNDETDTMNYQLQAMRYQLGLAITAATVTAIFYFIPIFLPLFTPGKWQFTNNTNFRR
jgi:hypothetical protein